MALPLLCDALPMLLEARTQLARRRELRRIARGNGDVDRSAARADSSETILAPDA